METIKNDKPIIEFENEEQMNECLNYWKDKLMLNDWIIKCYLTDEMIVLDGVNCVGKHDSDYVSKVSCIDILTKKGLDDYLKRNGDELVTRFCHEKTLVHELLHVKIPMFESEDSTVETANYEITQHALIESLAKTLIMTKYNLDFDWFTEKENDEFNKVDKITLGVNLVNKEEFENKVKDFAKEHLEFEIKEK